MAGSTSETPVLDLLESMTADSLAASELDPETLMLARIAALVAVDAPAVSYLLNIGAASEIGIDAEQVRGVLAAIAPKATIALGLTVAICRIRNGEQVSHSSRSGVRFPGGRHLMMFAM